MATITARRRADGATAYTALIRIKRKGKIVHSEARTFPRKVLAKQWASEREIELRKPGLIESLQHNGVTVGELIKRYINEFGDNGRFGRSKQSSLEWLKKQSISELPALSIDSNAVVSHALSYDRGKRAPATINNDIVWLRVVFKVARSAWGVPVDLNAVEEAASLLRNQRVIGKANRRDRRPTVDELEKLSEHFTTRNGWSKVPMNDIMWFAVYSARRQGEITRITWSDNDADDLTGVVRDAKHPRNKAGNDRIFKYTQQAWDIVDRQPKGSERIFPYDAKTVGSYFTKACKILGIKDLRFHDLRHEATSRLFEAGYSIHEVQHFTLHESWTELKRYTHLKPADIKLR